MKAHSFALRKAVAVLAAASLGLTACGSSSDTDAGGGGGSSSAPIRALLNAQPATLDPIVGARSAQVVWATMLEPLVHTDDELEPDKTGLVTEWTRDDPTTWTFTMREGVTFSNGEKADAAAAANTLLLSRDTDASILKSYFANVTSVEATDATTFVVKTKSPQYDLPNLLTTVYLVPPAYYEEKGSEGFAAAPVGTGPYVLDKVQAGRSISVKQNPDYWGEKPANQGVVFTWSTEASQRLALLQSKSVDLSFDLPPAQVAEAEKAGIEVVSTESAMKIIAFLDSTKAPFDDAKLREAAALAIDRDAIVKGIFDGNASADGGLLNVKPGTEPAEQVEADPAKAAELVGGDGPTVPITYPAGQYTNIEEVAQAVGGSLEQAGFEVKYQPVDYGTLVKQVIGRQLNGLYIFAGVPNVAVPDFFASGFMKTASITGNCPDPRMDELTAKALEQDDAAAAQSTYDELNTLGVVEKHCYVPLYRQTYSYGLADGVSGTVYSPLNAVDFTQTTH
ncbi:ABC transporter substrate-binding protein [Nocardioides nitrophenolicus]|uniref:ABC transporter substrate-binding protein n=1 Tax=Nocardioides nitrophenolicus TaxID=60489 RepID=UPI001958F2B9|nr:ABC transporter substrate-binding protein [Nocardioides nitrophenolicus]MBM7517490.1 peptide/nickel transport system substrate-binding protein [Nocardioides nitrophenolicus]